MGTIDWDKIMDDDPDPSQVAEKAASMLSGILSLADLAQTALERSASSLILGMSMNFSVLSKMLEHGVIDVEEACDLVDSAFQVVIDDLKTESERLEEAMRDQPSPPHASKLNREISAKVSEVVSRGSRKSFAAHVASFTTARKEIVKDIRKSGRLDAAKAAKTVLDQIRKEKNALRHMLEEFISDMESGDAKIHGLRFSHTYKSGKLSKHIAFESADLNIAASYEPGSKELIYANTLFPCHTTVQVSLDDETLQEFLRSWEDEQKDGGV